MCRWLAYTGSPVLMWDLLYKPEHSLIVQSMNSTLGYEPTNGDGFSVGWYGEGDTPGVFRSTEPAWNDRNLAALSAHIRSSCVLAHVRASTGSPVQQTSCHPFCPRAPAVHAQRAHPRLPGSEARPGDGGGPLAVPGHRGDDRF